MKTTADIIQKYQKIFHSDSIVSYTRLPGTVTLYDFRLGAWNFDNYDHERIIRVIVLPTGPEIPSKFIN